MSATVYYSVGRMLFATTFFNETVTLEQPDGAFPVLFWLVALAFTAVAVYAGVQQGHTRVIENEIPEDECRSHTVSPQKLAPEAVSGRVGFISSRFCSEMVSNLSGTVKNSTMTLVWPCCTPA